jgi:hypothetical protein
MTELHLCAAALPNIATALTTPPAAYVAIANEHAAIECGGQVYRLHRDENETGAQFDVRVLHEAKSMSPFLVRMTFGSFRQMLADNER